MAIIIMVHVEISLSRFHFKEGVARDEADQKFLECHRVVVDNQALPLLEKKDVYLIIGNDWFLN